MDPERAKELLSRERTRLERELEALSGGDRDDQLSDVDQHMADYGSELFEEERDQGIAIRLREQLAAVERAEQRLRDGSYGRSVQSGEPIPDARLEAIPWAERTAEEQRRYEHSG